MKDVSKGRREGGRGREGDLCDDILHVVRHIVVRRDERIQSMHRTVCRVTAVSDRGFVLVGKRKVIKEITKRRQSLDVICEGQMGDTTLFGMSIRTTQLLSRHLCAKKKEFRKRRESVCFGRSYLHA
jgi:hypothetical protein